MPWNPEDATKHTKKANSPAKAKVWSAIANQVLQKTGDDARAIREANSAVSRIGRSKKGRR